MRIFQLLKKHYLATILLIISIGVLIYAGADLSKNRAQEVSPPLTETNNAITLEPANQIARIENTEINKPKEKIANKKGTNETPNTIETPSKQTPTNTNSNLNSPIPQSTSTPVNLTQGTFIISGKSYPVEFILGSSVYSVMKNLNDNGKVSIKFKNYSGLGHFVDGLDGVNSDTFRAKYWIYYINGAKAQIGISQYALKQNDIITWKYEQAE